MVREYDEIIINQETKKRIIYGSMFIFGLLIGLCITTPRPIMNNTYIYIHLPENFNMSFYNDDNTTLLFQSEYNIYLIMVSGSENNNFQINHIKHFINETLLAYFLDVSLYNLSYVTNYHHLNGKTLDWNFEYNQLNDYYSIQAFDFSIYNNTNHYWYMDFGNTEFLNITLKPTNHIYINEISCFHEYNNIYRPYLNFTYENENYLEKMAWNITISI